MAQTKHRNIILNIQYTTIQNSLITTCQMQPKLRVGTCVSLLNVQLNGLEDVTSGLLIVSGTNSSSDHSHAAVSRDFEKHNLDFIPPLLGPHREIRAQ